MRIFLTLLKTSLNINFGISALRYRFTKEKKKRWEPFAIGAAILFGGGSLVVLYTLLMLGIYAAGTAFQKPEIILTMAFLFGQFFILIFGLFYLMSAFYFSKDMELLIPMPLKPYHVLGSKFGVVMVNEYLTLLPILLPPILIFGIGTSQGVVYWFKALMLILASPVIPLIVSALFIMILMRFVNFRKSKDVLTIVGGFLGLFFGLGMNLFSSRMTRGNEGQFIQNLAETMNGLTEKIGSAFPPSIWATHGLAGQGLEGWGYFMLFLLVSILLLAVLLWLGNRIFYKSVISGQEVTRKRKRLSAEEADKSLARSSSPVVAIFWKEWRLLLRTPVFVMNGLTGIIIGPFMIVAMMFAGGQAEGLGEISKLVNNPELGVPVTLGGLAFMLFSAGMNIVASTALSREGHSFWISKMIPVPPRKQALSKLLHGSSVSFLGILVTGIVLAAFFDFTVLRVILLFVLGAIGSVLCTTVNLIIDVAHPKLEWTNPHEAVKQNINGFFGILATILLLIVLGVIAVLMISIGMPGWFIYLSLGILMTVLTVACSAALFAMADRRYSSFEA